LDFFQNGIKKAAEKTESIFSFKLIYIKFNIAIMNNKNIINMYKSSTNESICSKFVCEYILLRSLIVICCHITIKEFKMANQV